MPSCCILQLPYAGDWVGGGVGVGDILPTLVWSMKSKVKDRRKLVSMSLV